MHNMDIIHLTENGEFRARHLAENEFGDARDDIISYLLSKNDYHASCEELGMNLKLLVDELKEAIDKLEKEGYIAIQNPEGLSAHPYYSKKADEEPLPGWACKQCAAENIAQSHEPRKVYCARCGAQHTVTGRDIHGKLYVQQFASRGDIEKGPGMGAHYTKDY